MLDHNRLMSAVLKTVQDWAVPAFKAIDERFAELAERIKAIPAGEKGDPGSEGQPGRDGADGQKGEKGDPGDDGPAGKDGRDGRDFDPALLIKAVSEAVSALPKPRDGVDGRDGKDGADGAPGVKGDPGADGLNGKDGSNGQDGKDGLSAYDIAKAEGFTGNKKEWLESLVHKDGKEAVTLIDMFIAKHEHA